MKEFAEFKDFLKKNDDFVLVGHKNADGDCIGTMCAFAVLLEKLKKNFELIVADPIPSGYLFLKFAEKTKIVSSFNCEKKPVILFECTTVERSGIELKNLGKTVNFDHHPDNTFYADLNIVNPNPSSVGEMASLFFKEFYPDYLNSDMANALYTAIHTDTGGFSYSNTGKTTFEVAAYLTEKGLDVQKVCNEVYGNNSLEKTKLLGYFLQNLKLKKTGNILICFGVLTLEDLERFGCSKRDTENFANYPRGIRGVDVGIFLLEVEKGVFKVSLRSKGKVVVNTVAASLSGGGHKFAAGCTVRGESQSVLSRLFEEFEKL